MIGLNYNEMMERWDIEMFSQLGDLKEMVAVAYIEDSTITFLKPLCITDVQTILNKCEELKHELERNPSDDFDEEPMSNCCSAPFGHPGWPDNDLCSKCHEHADIWKKEVHIELNPDE